MVCMVLALLNIDIDCIVLFINSKKANPSTAYSQIDGWIDGCSRTHPHALIAGLQTHSSRGCNDRKSQYCDIV